VRPSTLQFRCAPIVAPAIGVAHVPRVALVADPHENVSVASRTSYDAGCPVPSLTSVNVNVAPLSLVAVSARSVTWSGLARALLASIVGEPAATPGSVIGCSPASHANTAASERLSKAHRIRDRRWNNLNANGIVLHSFHNWFLERKKGRQLCNSA